MNLAFSTRGWREKDWMKQMEDACEMQFQGIEVYNLHKIESLIDRGGPFHKYNRNETERANSLNRDDVVISFNRQNHAEE